MKNIPYYDFSHFPVSDDILLKIIDSAVNNKLEMIFINFGSSFPWSLESIISSDFVFSEKLIEKIVNTCRLSNIILVPVLSIMIDSDFILRDGKYKYMLNADRIINGLDPSFTGAHKFIEELIDDIFSILMYSKYLLIELPPDELVERSTGNNMICLLKRLAETLGTNKINLMLACHSANESSYINEKLNGIPVFSMIPEKKIQIFKGFSYQLSIKKTKIVIKNINYKVFCLKGTEDFIIPHNADYIVFDINTIIEDKNINKKNLENIDSFFYNLDFVWIWIRKSRENLSLIYRNTDQIHRTIFLRSINKLAGIYTILKELSVIIIESLEKDYQPGVLKQWIDSKMDSVYIQLSELELIAGQIGGDH